MTENIDRLAVLIEANTKSYERAIKRIETKTNRALRNMQRHTQRTSRGFDQMAQSASTLSRIGLFGAGGGLSAVAIGRSANAIATAGDRLKLMEGRFTALTGSAFEGRKSLEDVIDIAQRTSVSVEDVSSQFSRLTLAAQDLGASREEVGRLTETVLKLGRIGGASTSELSGGATQLAQALASGRLQGDELRSILENLPLVARQIADGLGVSVGQLRKMGSEGELTAERVFGALLKGAEKVDKKFEELPSTVAGATQRMATSFDLFLARLDQAIGASEKLASVFNTIGRNLNDALSQPAPIQALRDELSKLEAERSSPGLALDVHQAHNSKTLDRQISRIKSEIAAMEASQKLGDIESQMKLYTPPARTTPATPTSSSPSSSSSGGGSRFSDMQREAQRAIEQSQRVIDQLKFEAAQLSRTSEEQELYNRLRSAGVELISEAGQNIASLVEHLQTQEAAQERLNRVMEQNHQLGETFGSAASSALNTLLTDSENAREAMVRLGLSLAAAVVQARLLNGLQSSGASNTFAGGFVSSLLGGLSSFNGGGRTGMGSRSQGIDGKGGFPAILHPNETVVDHTKGSGMGPTINIDARGAEAGVEQKIREQVTAALADYNRNVAPKMAVQATSRANYSGYRSKGVRR